VFNLAVVGLEDVDALAGNVGFDHTWVRTDAAELAAGDALPWHLKKMAGNSARVHRVAGTVQPQHLFHFRHRNNGGVCVLFFEGVAGYDEGPVLDRIGRLLGVLPEDVVKDGVVDNGKPAEPCPGIRNAGDKYVTVAWRPQVDHRR